MNSRKDSRVDGIQSTFKTNFFLEFTNPKLSDQFNAQYFKNQHFYIEIYLVFLIFVMVMAYFLRNCLDPEGDTVFRCSHKTLYVFSMFSLIATFFIIKNSKVFSKSLVFMRICFIFGTLYINIWIISLEIISENIWILITLVISVSNFVIYVSWRHHLIFTLANILAIYYYLCYFDYFLYKLLIIDSFMLIKILFFGFFMAGLKEKLLKELWILIESSKKTEKNLEKFIEDLIIPVMMIDAYKNIILINRYCTVLLDSVESSNKNKENVRSYIHRSLEDFFSDEDVEFLDSIISGCLNRQAVFSRLFVIDEGQRKANSTADEQKNMRKIISDLSEYVEDSNLTTQSLYELTASTVYWKSTKCVMVLLKPLRNLQAYLQIKKSLEMLAQNNLDFLISLIEEENFKIKSSNVNLSRPPSLYVNRKSLKGNNYEYTPSFLEMQELKYELLISQELSCFLQHRFPSKNEFSFKFSDFLLHFLEIFNNIANSKIKGSRYAKSEILISAEKLSELPDIIKGDSERLEEILAFLLLPILRRFEDLARITITCDSKQQNMEESQNRTNGSKVFFVFMIEILRKNDDDRLELFLKAQGYSLARKNQQEVYEKIMKTLQNDDTFIVGLNLLPFILKSLDVEFFDVKCSGFLTTVKFTLPFTLEDNAMVKSPSNYLKYNEINLDLLFHIVISKKRKGIENEYVVFSMEKKSLRSFEDLGFIDKRLEPSSSDSAKGCSAKSSPLKKHKNHKGLREDLLKMVSPENSYHSSNEQNKEIRTSKPTLPLPLPIPPRKELPKICSNVFEIGWLPEKKEREIEKNVEFKLKVKPSTKITKENASLNEILENHVDNYMELLEEKYKETLEKTIVECLKLRGNISLHEIHEELFNLIMEDNKFKFCKVSFGKVKSPKKKTNSINSGLLRRAYENHEEKLPPPPILNTAESDNCELNFHEGKTQEKGSTIIHDDISSMTDKKLENQLDELFQGYENQASSLKMEEMEEIKEELEGEFFPQTAVQIATHSNKNSPYSKTIHPYNKSKFDKLLISPINRPMNILKIRTRNVAQEMKNKQVALGKYLKN